MTEKDTLTLTSLFTRTAGRGWATAIMLLLLFACVFLAFKWQSAEAEKDRCYQESVQQEQRHSAEKETILKAQLEQYYKLGELTAKVDQLAKKNK